MATDRQAVLNAIAKYGPSVAHVAQRYGISGEALLAKTLERESRALSDPEGARNAVSSAGARKWAQFMPGTRAATIQKFGIDPWRSIDEGVHGMSLHLRGKITGNSGLEGYNPGDPAYPDDVLKTRVGDVHKLAGGAAPGATPSVSSAVASAASAGTAFDPGQGGALQQAVALRSAPRPVSSGMPPAPSFAAGPTLPQGYPALPSGGGPMAPQPVSLPDPTQTSIPALGTDPAGAAGETGTGGSGTTGAGSNGAGAALHPGGGYEGTEGLARHAKFRAAKAGWGVSSEKRNTKGTATGGISDHFVGKKNAWADDFSNGSQTANDEGRSLAGSIAERYGVKFVEDSYDSGGTIRVGDGRFRIQILYGDKIAHGDHVHVGFERVA